MINTTHIERLCRRKVLALFGKALLMAMVLMPFMSFTATTRYYWGEVNGIYWSYSLTEGASTVTIEGGGRPIEAAISTNVTGAIDIPATLGGYPVGRIGDFAFKGCGGLTSVTIPSTVTSIGDCAFMGCGNLTTLLIPKEVTSIGEHVFCDCGGLVSIAVEHGNVAYCSENGVLYNLSQSEILCWPIGKKGSADIISSVVRIGSHAFHGCSGLISVTIPSDVTNIGDYAFYGCSGLASVIIPSSVRSVGNYAFYGCGGLSSLIVPDGVTHIGSDAFSHCAGLTSAVISEGVISIGDRAFYDCSGLSSVVVQSSETDFGSGVFIGCNNLADPNGFVIVQDVLYDYFGTAAAVEIPVGVKRIDDVAFSSCSSMTSVTIPEGVVSIGESAFYGCSELISVVIPDSIVEIGVHAFYNCWKLKSIAPEGAEGIASVVLPFGVKRIGAGAFRMSSVFMPQSLTDIGNLETVWDVYIAEGDGERVKGLLLESGTDISRANFYSVPLGGEYARWLVGRENPEDVNVQSNGVGGVVIEGRGPMGDLPCQIAPWQDVISAEIGDGVTRIGNNAFRECAKLKSVHIPLSIEEVGDCAFYGCRELSLTIPSSVTSIGERAFQGCESMSDAAGFVIVRDVLYDYFGDATSVTIPQSIMKIEKLAFEDCNKLTSVVISSNVTEIGADAFVGCTKLTKVAFPSGMKVTREKLRGWGLSDAVLDDYVEGDFVIVNTSLLGYVGAADVAELVIPDGIELIDEYALSELYDLERVELPETVKYIGKGAFANDTYLDEMVLSDSVEVIGEGAFADCSWMQTMTMGAGVRSVGNRAFAGCTKLAAAKFAEGLGEVGDAAFSNCWRMMSVSLPLSVSNVAATAFKDCASLTGVTVPTGYGRAGARPSQTGTMAEWFAPVYRQIENVTVPEGTTEVCAEMFAGCAALKTVELPEGVTNIASGVFRDCVALETILLPESLEAIGDEAFAGCAALKAIVLPKNVAVLGNRVFSGCATLADVTLSRALMAIPDGTFAGCDALDSFVVPEAVTTLGSQIVPSATTAIYYLGNAPAYAADVYAQANASLVSYVVEGTKGWDGRPASRDIPRNWPTTNARAITTWPPIKIDVTFVGNGGAFENPAGESCVCKQIVDTAYSLPPYEPVRKGYRFDGYWTEANGGTRVTSGVAVKLTKDHSLYAHWKEYDTPTIEGDEGATVTGDAETGFVINPSEGKTAVEVTIPPGVDVAKVTVEVTPKVATVKPNGAKVKIVVGDNDITGFLVIPESEGVLNIAAATVKEEIVKETLDPSKDAVIELDAANPKLITAPTRKGLFYQLREGVTLGGMKDGDSIIGDGEPWTPEITVKGGNSAFYSIGVGKGE